jgi:hypothetical protein
MALNRVTDIGRALNMDVKYPQRIQMALDKLDEAIEALVEEDAHTAMLAIGLAEGALMQSQWEMVRLGFKVAANEQR